MDPGFPFNTNQFLFLSAKCVKSTFKSVGFSLYQENWEKHTNGVPNGREPGRLSKSIKTGKNWLETEMYKYASMFYVRVHCELCSFIKKHVFLF